MKLKKSVKRKLIIFLIIILVCVLVFFYFKISSKKVTKVKVIDEIKEYGYTLKDSKSKLYKDEFDNLRKILSSSNPSEEKYVESISKLYIIDFYSLSDKFAKTDVGGSDFVYKEELADFLENAEDTMYKYVESNLYGGRKQNLPTVKSVKVKDISKDTFKYGSKTDDDAYKVTVTWDYTDSSGDGYQDSAVLIFIHDGKKLSLVEASSME